MHPNHIIASQAEMSPEAYPWNPPPQMLWMGAVASGLRTFQGQLRDWQADKTQLRQKRPSRGALGLVGVGTSTA